MLIALAISIIFGLAVGIMAARGLGTSIDAARLAGEFGADIAVLLPIIDAGEMLGLVKSHKGNISLTDFGLKFQRTSKHKIRLLRDELMKIEPFRTAVHLASKRQDIGAGDVADYLAMRRVRWHHEAELNQALVKMLLIHWAIYAGLLSYNGKTVRFGRA
jgi:hypothetical protein